MACLNLKLVSFWLCHQSSADGSVLVQERVKLGCQSLAGFEVFFDFRFLSLIKRTVDYQKDS
jgi:hypothetical protein